MTEQFPPQEPEDFETVGSQAEWQAAFEDNVRIVGDALGSWGDALARHVSVRLVEGDTYFTPVPHFKEVDTSVEVSCNTDAFELWLSVLGGVDDMTGKNVRDLYLATAATWVELAYLSKAARLERNGSGVRNVALKRTASIMSKLQSKSELVESAEKLETEHGIVGAAVAIENQLTPKQAVEINRIRYGLAAAMYALDYTSERKEAIKHAFRTNLAQEVSRYESSLLDLLDSISHPANYAYFQSNFEEMRQMTFPDFLFAGTIPMEYGN